MRAFCVGDTMPPENIDARIWAALLGAIGAGISMQFVKGLTWAQKIAMVATGVVLAVVFTPLVTELMALPVGWSDGIAALIGILGWAIDRRVCNHHDPKGRLVGLDQRCGSALDGEGLICGHPFMQPPNL